MDKKNYKIETQCVQGSYDPGQGEARVLPIVQSTTFKYYDSDTVADLFDLKQEGFFYTRLDNPTVSAFEGKMALLEKGTAAIAVASGQSASMFALLNLCHAGDHVICSSKVYGGTSNLFGVTLNKVGIDVTFVDPDSSYEEILKAATDHTKALFGETIGNPNLNILDFEKFSRVAKTLDVPFIVDNTIATPYLCRPLEHGANIVIHSASKYIDGHACAMGGVVIDGGNYNWDNGKFPEFTEPDESYHGVVYNKDFAGAPFVAKARLQLLRDYGCVLSPFNAFLLHQGLETLHLRMERHSENALKLAEYLQKHPKIEWVNYPLLEGNPYYDLAKKYTPKGASGILTAGFKGGAAAGKEVVKFLKLTSLVVHLGDARTSLLHPASTTHRQLTEEQQIAAGVMPEMVRISVGLENIEDIIEDFDQALAQL